MISGRQPMEPEANRWVWLIRKGQKGWDLGSNVAFVYRRALTSACTRDWVATDTVRIWAERRTDEPSLFTVRKGERVAAITGVVVTTRAGRVEFREPADLFTESGLLRIEPGQFLYLLTYHGEGETKAWFNGRLYERVDGAMDFFNALCEIDPSRCTGRVVEPSQSVWWVQVRNTQGRIGWTNQPDKFGNKDRFGK